MKNNSFLHWLQRASLRLGMLLIAGHAYAGPVDLADRPLSTMADGTLVRSNLMFVLDDSGSMGYSYLPDDAPQSNVCYGSADRNYIFFDPTRTYAPPLKADGTAMLDASFTAAKTDGYSASSSVVDLTNNNPATPSVVGATIGTPSTSVTTVTCGKKNDGACSPPASTSTETYDAGTNTTTTTDTSVIRVNASPKSCGSTANSCALQTTVKTTKTEGAFSPFLWATRKTGASSTSCTASDFNIVKAANATAAQKQNYANWYAYYRTRMLAMRAGAGRAFASIDASRFRVGFSKISQHANGGADSTGFLNVRDFDVGTQKADFFTRLYSTSGTGYTPLRPALARAGRYFAKKLTGQSDPMQYACQRNYTILSTDGYWNEDEKTPKRLDGTTEIGNTDAGTGVERPMRDAFNSGAGVGNTLADVAQYYYVTDLRTSALSNCTGSVAGQDVCENMVPTDAKDTSNAQHMTTFTMGLGLSGRLTYDKDYEAQRSGDFFEIKQGTKVWPDPISNSDEERIDDLWHAAVNGRGTYYSANNASEMAASLVDALTRIEATTGSSSAAATSSLTPTAGDDWLFIPLYTTKTWDGTVHAHKIDTATGAVLNPTKPIWSAAERIKNQSSRTILFNNGGTLVAFDKDNLTSASKLSHFEGLCTTGAEKLTQCASLSADAKAKATAENLISFLRGSSTYEASATAEADQVFRTRKSPLGDIVNGAPVYVKKSPLAFSDHDYSAHVAKTASRQGVLYVAANDGMLHAIKVAADVTDATGGTELWAYVPSMVMENMYLLADRNYETRHRFFVDGAPAVSDIFDGTEWRTILVGGLGKGGRGYYALDITDPGAPKALWEFTDTDLGYTYGNPVITKNKAGRWVVMFTSGYNNASGRGYLYVVDAVTGALVDAASKIATGAGSSSNPSNLGKINVWVEDEKLAVASRVYGGDMLGNVWRFDFDDNLGPAGKEKMLLATTASTQPITTKPVLTEIIDGSYKYVVVSVGTGRYLGTSDVGDSSLQSIYTFKDDLTTTGLGALRSNAGMVKQTFNSTRTGLESGATVNWATKKGWYVDLDLTSGERVNIDFDQQLNQLIVATNIPSPTVCSPGGSSWLYFLDVGSGKPLVTYSSPKVLVGITPMVTSSGKLVVLGLKDGGDPPTPYSGSDAASTGPGTLRRTSWRELMN
ncbi:MAG: pilus assembly protein PilY [Burkholderiales bacterium]|nr:MAG: pilus assembly protein PilY [Burkholderiales bacterium]